jgi:hypothetical protein
MKSMMIFIIHLLLIFRFFPIECNLEPKWKNSIDTIFSFPESVRYLNSFVIESENISKECRKSISQSLVALENLEDWSCQMYNSWGKFPPNGIIEGTVTDFGDYDQCLAIQPNQVIGKSQYCLIDISLLLPKPMPIHQNIFHRVDVLPHFVNKSGNNVFVKLSKDASFFYWVYIRLGICSTIKCSEKDVKNLAEKSKFAISEEYFDKSLFE